MKVEDVITQRIIEKLESGVVPWHKPWCDAGAPKNLITKKEYRGVNVFLLACAGYASPFWASYKQISELGGVVKKGEHGFPVVFWKFVDCKEKDESGAEISKKIPFLRYYTVFNTQQTEGIDEKKIPALEKRYNEIEKIEQCEQVVFSMPQRPEILNKEQRAYYVPSTDHVNMPGMETFDGSAEYYSTLFHELTHSTGHESRLNRKGITGLHSFGTQEYSKEELIAEMGAAFLCGHCQIENKTIDNSASYIKSWLRKFEDDRKMVIFAAAAAQKAVDFILNRKHEEN